MLLSTFLKKRANNFDKNIEFFEDKINSNYFCQKNGIKCPTIYTICNQASELKHIKIPENCVIKYNNLSGSKGVVIRKNGIYNKGKNIKEVIKYLELNKKQNPKCQKSIKNIKQKILVEELLINSESDRPLVDIKLYCFKGEVKYIMLIDPNNRKEVFTYNTDLKRVKIDVRDADLHKNIEKPKYLEEIIKNGNYLAKKFFNNTFLRIDFYSTTKGAIFGEFTFRPGNTFLPNSDKILGKLI